MADFLEELGSLHESTKDERLDEKKTKVELDKIKALKVRQHSWGTFSQTRKRRNEEGEVAPTKSNKNNVLT